MSYERIPKKKKPKLLAKASIQCDCARERQKWVGEKKDEKGVWSDIYWCQLHLAINSFPRKEPEECGENNGY